MNLSHCRWTLALLGVAVAACGDADATPPGAAKAGNRPAAKVVVLKLADHDGTRDVSEFVAAVERLSHGTMRIEVSDGWRVHETDYDRGTLADVRADKVDMAKIAARSWDRFGVKTLQPLVAPLLVDNLALEGRVMTDGVGREMLDGVNRAGVTAIGLLPGDLRHPVTLDGDPLLGPSTYRGRNIGIRPSALSVASLRALGASAEGYVPGGDLPGLNGLEADLPTLDGNEYDRPEWSFTGNVVLWPRAVTLVLGPAAARRLSPSQQRILRQAVSEAIPGAIRRLEHIPPSVSPNLCVRRLTIVQASEADLADLRTALTPIRDAISADPQGRAALARIDALKRELAAPADVVPSCPSPKATQPRTSVPKVLKGTWVTSFTREEYVAAHPNPGEPIDENWGTFMISIRDGRFNASDCPHAAKCSKLAPGGFGDVAVHGNRITFTLANEPGGGWSYYWSVYRDRLTFRRIPGDSDNPTGFIVKPYRRWTG